MTEPHRTASGVIVDSPLVLVDVVTDGGTTGHGIVFTYTPSALRPVADLITNIGQLVVGEMLAPSAISDKLHARFRLLGTQGLVGMAIAGIDMALWDALALLHGMPLTRLLGGVERPIQAYGAVGYDGALQSGNVAERWAKRGFRGVKAKIGYPDVKDDIEVIHAIRRAAGEDVSIMVDYNQSLTTAEAIERLRRLDDLGLTWIEEPTLAHDFEGHARIAGETRTPIQCGENWWGPLDFRHGIRSQSSDFLMPEVMKAGGVTGWQRVAAMAEAQGMRVSNHLWSEVSTQLLSVTPMAHWLEYSDWWSPILKSPLQVEDGFAWPSTEPGSGVSWNEAGVVRCLA